MLIITLLLILLSSCGVRTIPFDEDKIIKKERKGFQVFLDLKPMKLWDYEGNSLDAVRFFLNEGNIDQVVLDRIEKRIDIKRNKNSYIKSLDFLIDEGVVEIPFKEEQDYLIVIDGVPYFDAENIYFEEEVVFECKWIDPRKLKENTFFHNGRKILIITTNNI